MIPGRDCWCVEFGAWDGKVYSNTFHLVESQSYRPVLIECDPARVAALKMEYPFRDRAVVMQKMVGWSGENTLDNLLLTTPIPRDFDLLSVDIDGNDYHVWSAMNQYQPKLVLIEYNPTIDNVIDFVQEADSNVSQGSSAAAMVRLAKSKGYELIAATRLNLLFCHNSYFPLFNIEDNSLALMRDDSCCPRIFVGYDGHIFIRTANDPKLDLLWHNLQVGEQQLQVLPRLFRKNRDRFNLFTRYAYGLYRRAAKLRN